MRLVDDAAIRALNRDYRGKDAATDVLSFPAAPEPFALRGRRERAHLGDLAVSVETAGRQAAAEGHDLETELRILLLHGILHLAGHDHELDGGEMRARERELRRELGLPAGLIERASSGSRGEAARGPAPVQCGSRGPVAPRPAPSAAEVPETARGRGRVRH